MSESSSRAHSSRNWRISTLGRSIGRRHTPQSPSASTDRERYDSHRFHGQGVTFKGKLIGVLAVSEARGDRMCQDALSELKVAVRAAGEHKQRIAISICVDGLRLRDERTGDCLYHHHVHKISFIAQDISDKRAFGYVFGSPDTGHQFFGIKTEKDAGQVVMAMRDLFQVVFELKKLEIEKKKQRLIDEQLKKSGSLSMSRQSSLKREVMAAQSSASVGCVSGPSWALGRSALSDAISSLSLQPAHSVDLLDLQMEIENIEQGISQMSKRLSPMQSCDIPASTPDFSPAPSLSASLSAEPSPRSVRSTRCTSSSRSMGTPLPLAPPPSVCKTRHSSSGSTRGSPSSLPYQSALGDHNPPSVSEKSSNFRSLDVLRSGSESFGLQQQERYESKRPVVKQNSMFNPTNASPINSSLVQAVPLDRDSLLRLYQSPPTVKPIAVSGFEDDFSVDEADLRQSPSPAIANNTAPSGFETNFADMVVSDATANKRADVSQSNFTVFDFSSNANKSDRFIESTVADGPPPFSPPPVPLPPPPRRYSTSGSSGAEAAPLPPPRPPASIEPPPPLPPKRPPCGVQLSWPSAIVAAPRSTERTDQEQWPPLPLPQRRSRPITASPAPSQPVLAAELGGCSLSELAARLDVSVARLSSMSVIELAALLASQQQAATTEETAAHQASPEESPSEEFRSLSPLSSPEVSVYRSPQLQQHHVPAGNSLSGEADSGPDEDMFAHFDAHFSSGASPPNQQMKQQQQQSGDKYDVFRQLQAELAADFNPSSTADVGDQHTSDQWQQKEQHSSAQSESDSSEASADSSDTCRHSRPDSDDPCSPDVGSNQAYSVSIGGYKVLESVTSGSEPPDETRTSPVTTKPEALRRTSPLTTRPEPLRRTSRRSSRSADPWAAAAPAAFASFDEPPAGAGAAAVAAVTAAVPSCEDQSSCRRGRAQLAAPATFSSFDDYLPPSSTASVVTSSATAPDRSVPTSDPASAPGRAVWGNPMSFSTVSTADPFANDDFFSEADGFQQDPFRNDPFDNNWAAEFNSTSLGKQ